MPKIGTPTISIADLPDKVGVLCQSPLIYSIGNTRLVGVSPMSPASHYPLVKSSNLEAVIQGR